MAAEDTSPAQQDIPVVDQAEGQRINDSGGNGPNGLPAGPVMVDTSTPAPKKQAAPEKAPAKRPAYWDAPMGSTDKPAAPAPKYGGSPVSGYQQNLAPPGEQPPPGATARPKYWDADTSKGPDLAPPPPATTAAPTKGLGDRVWAAVQGFAGQSNELLQAGANYEQGFMDLADKIAHGIVGGEETPESQHVGKLFHDNVVDPLAQNQQSFNLDPNADMFDKIMHGIGGTAAFISQAIATGGAGEAAGPTMVSRGLQAVSGATVPLVASAINTGKTILEATGDQQRAIDAAVNSYLANAAAVAIPMGATKNVFGRVAVAATVGPVAGELSRQGQNAAMGGEQTPADVRNMSDQDREAYNKAQAQKTPFSLQDIMVNALTNAPLGLLPGGHEAPRVEERPQTIMEHAQTAAAAAVAAEGGDHLDQVVAAANVNASVGAVHDAVAFEAHGAMERANQLALEQPEQPQGVVEPNAGKAALGADKVELEPERPPEPPPEAPPPATIFERREQEQAKQKEEDYGKALNQKGDETVAQATNAQKGTEGAAPPTLGDTLTPEQASAFKDLAARRAAEPPKAPEPEPDEKVMPYVEPKGGEKNPIVGTEEAKPATPLQGLQARRNAKAMQAPELPPAEAGKPSGKVQAPDLRGESTAEPETPAEGDEWAAKDGTTYEVLKANDDGTYKVRSTPADTSQAPMIRTMREAAVSILRARTEEAPTQFAGVRAKGIEGQEGVSQEAVNRYESDRAAGRTTHLIDPDGQHTELTNPTDIDQPAPKGSVKYQKGVGIVDDGGLPRMQANGLVARAEGLHGFDREPTPTQMRDNAVPGTQKLSKEVAAAHLQPMIDRVGADKLQVHDHPNDPAVPQKIRDDIAKTGRNPDNIRGAYSDGVAHVFAGAHESAADLHDTAVHENAHAGIRSFLGDDYRNTMRDVYANIHDHESANANPIDGVNKTTGKAWIKDYMDQHGMDPRNPRDQASAADEYAAHLAEHGDENPTILRKVIDSVRAGLRKIGVVREWTDNDICRLLRESNNNQTSEHARAAAEYQGDTTHFADKEDRKVDQLSATNPLSQAHKFGKTMEDQANYNPGFVRSRANALRDWGGDRMRDGLMMIHMRNLPDFMRPDLMPSLRQFIRLHDQMTGRRGQMMDVASKQLTGWSKWASKNKEMAKSLGDLMHSSTLAGVDPSKPFEARYTDAEKAADATRATHDASRKDYYAAARRQYNGLDDQGKKLFNDVRDSYVKQRADTYKALNDRIEASGADDKTKKAIMASLRKVYEGGRVQGPYFPLMRYGDRMGSAHDKEGNVVAFSRFESRSEQASWLKEMAAKGYEVRGGQKMDDKSMMERIDPKFVQKVMEIAKDADPKLAEEIWQTYLKAMPEMSMRKQFIHRVGRLGYTMDAMRNFAYNSFHGAHQLARLEFGHRLDSSIDSMKTEAQAVMDKDPTSKNAQWAPALAKEMARRYEWVKNPRASPMASALTKFGFGWYLGAAPATAFRIFSQNPMLAQPILAKYHGQLGATRELSRASAQWAMSRGSLGDKLRGDERRAFDTAADRGVFSSTATQTLASGASDIPVTGHMATVMKAMGYLFNAMEHHNRMTTYLAGYRLGRQQGMSHDQAVDHATDTTWDAHFDYTNANRPRVLQNDVGKVLGLFKQYSWGVTYRLAREARNMIDGELSGEDRMRATKAMGGLLARVGAFSGATGLPLAWLANSVINAVFSDKDKPFDAEAAEHEYLKQHLGQTAADAVMTGPIGAMSGASLSGGASYSDLWYRAPSRDENAHDTVMDALAQIGGAIPAIPLNMASGAGMMKDGQIERGLSTSHRLRRLRS